MEGLSPEELGLLFSAFFWSYSLLQVPGGMVLDRFGVTRVGRWGAFLWALASAITAVSSGFGGIFAARVLLGVAEAPAFPANQKATGYWFPRNERARSTAIFDSAAKFNSGTGWPSFWQPVAEANVTREEDRGWFVVRTEVRCGRCDAHLGHGFEDGPPPTALRYCMHSAAPRFVARRIHPPTWLWQIALSRRFAARRPPRPHATRSRTAARPPSPIDGQG